jgi:type IV fimbrial biogenesis protein FimT
MRLPRHQLRARARSGFSIVELVVVVLIMGLIAGAMAMDWRAVLPRAKLNSTVHDLAAAIHGARSDAIARNGVFQIIYDLDANGYRVTSPFKVGGGLAQTDEERAVLRQIRFPVGVDLESVMVDGEEYTEGEVRVTFDPLGSASDHLVTISQPSVGDVGTTYTIEVLPLTGMIRFHYERFQREPVEEEDFR